MKHNTRYIQFKNRVTATNKTYFTVADLDLFYPSNRSSLQVLLAGWKKRGWIYHLGRGYYAFDLAQVDYLQLATTLYPQSYVSFEYALHWHGLIDQIPTVITVATANRSRKMQTANWTIEYTHLKPNLIFDYELEQRAYIATPEKALADTLYTIARGQRLVELDTLDQKKIDQKRLKKILKKFPLYVMGTAKHYGIL